MAGIFTAALLTHWMASSLLNDVPGRGWYHDSCTWLVNAAIARSGLSVEFAATVICWLMRAIAPAAGVLVFLWLSGRLTASRAVVAGVLGCLFAAGAPVVDAALMPAGDWLLIYEIARSAVGGLFLMWIIAPRRAQVELVVPAHEEKTVVAAAA